MQRETPIYFKDEAAARKHYAACANRPDLMASEPRPIALRSDPSTGALKHVGAEAEFFMGWVVMMTTWGLD